MVEYSIHAKNLKYSYDKQSKNIKGINLNIPKNSIYGFLGPNGSGKSTTIKMLLGLITNKGSAVYYGNTSFKKNRLSCLSRVGALIETPCLYEHLTARENLKIASRYRVAIENKRYDEVLNTVKLENVDKKKVSEFSLGMKQRLSIAIALLSNPEILILDEPTNGLDPKGIKEFRNMILDLNKTNNTTILISSHLLSEIEKLCTHIGIINKGKLIYENSLNQFKVNNKIFLKVVFTEESREKLELLFSDLEIEYKMVSNNSISFSIENKNNIPLIIKKLIKNQVDIYQFAFEDSLENFYLDLIEQS